MEVEEQREGAPEGAPPEGAEAAEVTVAELESRVLQLVRDGAAARRAVEIAEQMVSYAEARENQIEEALLFAIASLRERAYAERRRLEEGLCG